MDKFDGEHPEAEFRRPVGCGGFDGVDWVEWCRMVALMGGWGVDTEGADVEVLLCPQWGEGHAQL